MATTSSADSIREPGDVDGAREIQGAIARIYRRVQAEMHDNELGNTAVLVLGFVAKNGPQTLTALSEREHVSAPAMNQTVNTLQSAGLVKRQPDPSDGRKVLVAATDSGLALWADLRQARRAWLHSRYEQLTDQQRDVLAEAATILNQMAAS